MIAELKSKLGDILKKTVELGSDSEDAKAIRKTLAEEISALEQCPAGYAVQSDSNRNENRHEAEEIQIEPRT